jgi:hypothetical protein
MSTGKSRSRTASVIARASARVAHDAAPPDGAPGGGGMYRRLISPAALIPV